MLVCNKSYIYYNSNGLASLTTKILGNKFIEIKKVAKNHKIQSTNPGVVTENIFQCLEYLD